MSTKRTSITIQERLWHAAQQRIKDKYCDNFSEYVEALVREDVLANPLTTTAPRVADQGSADYLPQQTSKRKRRAS